MNKKLLKSFAAAAMSVLAIACAKEPVGPDEGALVEATFSVDVPGVEVSTKGLSDAASVNELICQVFLNDGNYTPVPDLNQTVEVKNKKAKVTFNLVKGQKYSFAFWAQVKGTGYYDTRDLRAVKMNVDAVKANDPAMDAYFAQKDFSALSTPVTDIKKNTVALYRAVAQVNFGTINSDRADKLEVVKSKIKLTEVPTVFDVVRGYKDDAYSVPATIEFKENVPVEEKLLVAGNEYDYLSTCYVFAYKDQKLTDATATFWVGSTSRTVSAPNAPYKRNMRTNILGDLLTINQDFNIVVDPDFKGGDKNYDSVAANLEAGKEVTLSEDYSVADESKGVTLDVGVTSVLNLNGKKFSNENRLEENKAALQVHGDLTINGDGEVYCEGGADNNAIIVEQGGHLVINGGTYNVGANTNSGKSNATIFVMGPDKYGRNGSVEINGGVFMAKAGSDSDATPFVLNQHDDITVNCFSVKGGTFVGFNPADNNSDGAHTNYVSEGYRAVEITYEGKQAWKVEEIPAVTTHEDFNSAITSASAGVSATIKLASNMTAVLDNGIANAGGNSEAEKAKRRNLTFIGDGTQTFDVITKATNAEGGMLNYQRGSSFTFKNMSIKAGEGNFDGVVCDELVYENCTITGKLTLYGKATFVNCVFENTMADQYSIWTWGGTDVKFDKCTFNTNGKAILLYGQATEAKPTNLIVTNCTLNDRKNGAAGKAAIEIGNDYNATYNLTISDCVINGFAEGKNTGSKTWANKNSMDAAHLSVTIDRVKIQ